jgi:hypothetical protein
VLALGPVVGISGARCGEDKNRIYNQYGNCRFPKFSVTLRPLLPFDPQPMPWTFTQDLGSIPETAGSNSRTALGPGETERT